MCVRAIVASEAENRHVRKTVKKINREIRTRITPARKVRLKNLSRYIFEDVAVAISPRRKG